MPTVMEIATKEMGLLIQAAQANTKQLTDNIMRNFKNAKMPLSIETYDGTNLIVHPDVFKIYQDFGKTGSDVPAQYFGYTYWMIATPYPRANWFYENPSLYVSNDGINWAVPPGVTNPIIQAPDPRGRVVPYQHNPGLGVHLSDPDIIVDRYDEKLKMIYRMSSNDPANPMPDTIYYTESSNAGITWSTPVSVLSVSHTILSASVVQIGQSSYEMYYVKFENGVYSIHKRTSSDMRNWSSEINLNIPPFTGNRHPWHLDVIKVQEGVELLVNAGISGTIFDTLFLLESSDGINFTFKNDGYPILERSEIGWDSGSIYRASFARSNNGYYQIWYSATDKNGNYRVGYLEGPIDSLVGIASETQGVATRQRFSFNKDAVTESYEGVMYAVGGDALVAEGMVNNSKGGKKIVRVKDQLEVTGEAEIIKNQDGSSIGLRILNIDEALLLKAFYQGGVGQYAIIEAANASGNENLLRINPNGADVSIGSGTNEILFSGGNIRLRGTTLIITGSGNPEGVVTAPVGSIFLRTDGGQTTTLYVKTSGTGNTGWTAK